MSAFKELYENGISYPRIKPGKHRMQITKFEFITMPSKIVGAPEVEFVAVSFEVLQGAIRIPSKTSLFEVGFKIFDSAMREQLQITDDQSLSFSDLRDLALVTEVDAWYKEVPKEGSNQPNRNWYWYDPDTNIAQASSEPEELPAPQNASPAPTKKGKAKREELPF